MEVSICITLFNEEKSVDALIASLLKQTKKAKEIIIIDGGSTDNTLLKLKKWKKNYKFIKVVSKNCNRAQGRNLSIKKAKYEIIAITDGDCAAKNNWLENITKPFSDKSVGMVAGFYKMLANSSFEKAAAFFLGITPKRFTKDFLPSTRSFAMRKSLWKKLGGFPEVDKNSAEDTDFNYLAVKSGTKISRVKSAIVYWKVPANIINIYKKFYDYAKWDGRKRIFWNPNQKLHTHNLKALLKIVRIFFAVMLFVISYYLPISQALLIVLVVIYILHAFFKVYKDTRDFVAGLWGVVLQFVSDFAVTLGFVRGLLNI